MQKIKYILLASLSLPVFSFAAPICAKSVKEFDQQKKQFPALFQELPALFTIDKFVAKGGVRVRAVGDKFKMEGSVDTLKGFYNDDSYIKLICVEGSKVFLTFENNKIQEVTVKGNTASIEGADFTKSTPDEFARLVNKARKKNDLPPMQDTTAPGVR